MTHPTQPTRGNQAGSRRGEDGGANPLGGATWYAKQLIDGRWVMLASGVPMAEAMTYTNRAVLGRPVWCGLHGTPPPDEQRRQAWITPKGRKATRDKQRGGALGGSGR